MEIANKFREEIKRLYLKTDSKFIVSMYEYLKPQNREIVFPAVEIGGGKDILFRITKQYIHKTIDEHSNKLSFVFNKIDNALIKILPFSNGIEQRYIYNKFFKTPLFKNFIVESLPMFANIDFDVNLCDDYTNIGIVQFKTGQMRDLLGDDYFSPFSLPIINIDNDYYFLMPATYIPIP